MGLSHSSIETNKNNIITGDQLAVNNYETETENEIETETETFGRICSVDQNVTGQSQVTNPISNNNTSFNSPISYASLVLSRNLNSRSRTSINGLNGLSATISPTFTISNSYSDVSHSLVAQQLGDNSNSLLPKLKTIELYKQNARKSHDPEVLYEYARYMLNTALFIDVESEDVIVSLSFEEKIKLKKQFLKEAIHYLRKLSDRGFSDAQYLLADAYSSGALGKVDHKEAFPLFQAAAKHGHVESSYRTSYCFEEGLGTHRDSRKALEFLKYAASKNHPSAMYKMGVYSFYARMGLPNNITTKKDGIKWLKRAVESANELIASAPYELGKIEYEGFQDIVIPDKIYALDLYRLAASLGHIPSAAILGREYELGEVVPQDPALSIHYYTMASAGGDSESMLGLCGWFMVGTDRLEKNEKTAFEWAVKAAEVGLPKAQFAVGHFLEKGIGCGMNSDNANMWFVKAADNGNERAVQRLKGTTFEKKDEKKKWVKKRFK
ncbi:hypothetical protein PACTADRAFT_184804 [Pachysolen tannophilus NRRL Y-2460]|uniref:HCP-like protein n=1 Tax=Pachysolen tannophilus NRRL Y-2460 TaxID=669874 RepID=A0A1E4U3M9_PACTA|nr:hypothetical protein PACTADRAFT_184804 [Pachysolen tannophilus NRRL Y-2460]